MKTYRLKVWTGPSYVKEMGRMIKRAHLKVPVVGTEHVYVDVKGTSCYGAAWNMQAMLYRKFRTDFGLRVSGCQVRQKR